MPERGTPARRFAWLIAGTVGAGLLAWAAVTIVSPGGSRSRTVTLDVPPSASSALPSLAVHRPAEVRMALLFDCYEHGIEHAPPRDPSGVMQRRDRHYTPGPNPFTLLRARLTRTAGDESARRWLDSWAARWIRGDDTAPPELDELERTLVDTSLSSDTLLKAGVALNFLDGDKQAARWYRAGFRKAQEEGVRPDDPRVTPLLALLDQTKALWRLKDYEALEWRFALAKGLSRPRSAEARRAGYLHAEMLYHQQLYAEAGKAMAAVQREHEQAGDLGALETSDHSEMYWVLGLMLHEAREDVEAVAYLRRASHEGPRRREATLLLFKSLLRCGRTPEAEDCYTRLIRDFSLHSAAARNFRLMLEDANQ